MESVTGGSNGCVKKITKGLQIDGPDEIGTRAGRNPARVYWDRRLKPLMKVWKTLARTVPTAPPMITSVT